MWHSTSYPQADDHQVGAKITKEVYAASDSCVCMYIYIYIYTYTYNMCIHIYIYIYTCSKYKYMVLLCIILTMYQVWLYAFIWYDTIVILINVVIRSRRKSTPPRTQVLWHILWLSVLMNKSAYAVCMESYEILYDCIRRKSTRPRTQVYLCYLYTMLVCDDKHE